MRVNKGHNVERRRSATKWADTKEQQQKKHSLGLPRFPHDQEVVEPGIRNVAHDGYEPNDESPPEPEPTKADSSIQPARALLHLLKDLLVARRETRWELALDEA